MTRWLPRTLFGQMVLILLAGLAASHVVGTLIFASDRSQAVRTIGGYAATQRIANLARLVDEAPPDWRSRIVAAASDPTLRVSLSADPPVFTQTAADADARPIQRYLADQLPAPLAQRLRVAVSAAAPAIGGDATAQPTGGNAPVPPIGDYNAAPRAGGRAAGPPIGVGPQGSSGAGFGPHHMGMGGMTMGTMPAGGPPWMTGLGDRRRLEAAVQLTDGPWLSFIAALPNAGPSVAWPFMAAMAVMAVVVVLASVWAVSRVTAPLGVIARAAERFGRDVNAPPIAESGTREMRQAAQSFNQMQQRILRLLDNRTRMLAALSHDLRTPLTLLRLRTETLAEADERDRMLASISELDTMIGATLSFARDQAATETRRRTDLAALVASIADDLADAGLPVTMRPAEPVVLECQPGALRRALTNLIDNAVKYGKTARVAIAASASTVTIEIDDDGPGIPDADLRIVFEPFHRLEPSRSRDTGGTGLGLSIALSIAQAHGGEITLANRAPAAGCAGPCGLRATLTLPR